MSFILNQILRLIGRLAKFGFFGFWVLFVLLLVLIAAIYILGVDLSSCGPSGYRVNGQCKYD